MVVPENTRTFSVRLSGKKSKSDWYRYLTLGSLVCNAVDRVVSVVEALRNGTSSLVSISLLAGEVSASLKRTLLLSSWRCAICLLLYVDSKRTRMNDFLSASQNQLMDTFFVEGKIA